jgi:hypothetical protein
MQTVMNPMTHAYQSQLDASRRCAEVVFSGTERMERVVLDTMRRALNHQLNFMQSMAPGGDPNNAATMLQSSLMSQAPMDMMNSQREFMAIFAEMQNAIGKSMRDAMQDYMSRASAPAPGAAATLQDNAQRQADTPFNPVTGIFSVWESAFREAAALARKSVATARSAIEEAAIAGARNAAASSTMPPHVIEDADAVSRRTVGATTEDRNIPGSEVRHEGGEPRGTSGRRR